MHTHQVSNLNKTGQILVDIGKGPKPHPQWEGQKYRKLNRQVKSADSARTDLNHPRRGSHTPFTSQEATLAYSQDLLVASIAAKVKCGAILRLDHTHLLTTNIGMN